MSYAYPIQVPVDAGLTDGVLTRRVFAWLVDVVLIAILVSAAWAVLFLFGLLTLGLGMPLLALLPVVPFGYHTLFVAGRQAGTPGQVLMDLTVRREHDLGQPGLLQAVIFTGGLWLTLGSAFLLLVVAPFMPRKRALHDIVAGVVVVRRQALRQTLTAGHGSVNMGAGTSYV